MFRGGANWHFSGDKRRFMVRAGISSPRHWFSIVDRSSECLIAPIIKVDFPDGVLWINFKPTDQDLARLVITEAGSRRAAEIRAR
jgi:hypothetical protein